MRTITRMLGAAVAVTALVLTAGCTKSKDTPADKPGVEKVKYLTGATILGREAFVYLAMEKGYFKDAGFDVDVVAGKGTTPNLQQLQTGQVDFAAVDITAALIEYGNGRFKDFTVVNAIHQSNLQCVMTLDSSGITSPKDLAGKKIAYLPGGVGKALFPAYAKLAGIDESKIQWVNLPLEQSPQALAAGTVDAAFQFAVGKPGVERAAGNKKVVVMPYDNFLSDLYGVGVAVTRKNATGDPDRVRRFNDALLKGLKDAMDNPAEAGRIYAKYNTVQPAATATAENTLMVPFVNASGGSEIMGSLDPNRIARNIAIVQGAGLIPKVFQPEEVISLDLGPHGT